MDQKDEKNGSLGGKEFGVHELISHEFHLETCMKRCQEPLVASLPLVTTAIRACFSFSPFSQ